MKQLKFYLLSLIIFGFLCLLLIQYGCDKNEEVANNIPVAAFSCDQTEINLGQSIQFTDQSTNTPTSWLWDFSDGGTSTSQNPSHTYSTAGTYTVSLTATNSYGSGTETKTNYITVTIETVTDYDGNIYNTIKIGNQVWIAENLKSTHYANGTAIPLVESNSTWANLIYADKAYCYYDDLSSNGDTYGALYTWAAVMNGASSSITNPSGVQGVCPSGWHLPSDNEWKELEIHLGMSQADADNTGYRGTNEGSKLAGNSSLWSDGDLENDAAFGTSGFTALPGGVRYNNVYSAFYNLGYRAYFWSATEYNSSYAWYRILYCEYSVVGRGNFYKNCGFSVRCIKD